MNRDARPATPPAALAHPPGAKGSIRILVVDDSPFMQRRLTEILEQTPDLRVVGRAQHGGEAVTLAERLRPDVITMDLNMPHMDGLQAIDVIMRTSPRPIVVISSHTRRCARAAFDALEAGAVEIVAKPSDRSVSLDLDSVAEEIVRKVRQAARIRVVRSRSNQAPAAARPPVASNPAITSAPRASLGSPRMHDDPDRPALIAIGSSTGGPVALRQIFQAIRHAHLPPVLIVQHLPPGFTRDLASQLSALSPIEVVEAAAGQIPRPGVAYVAPGGQHLEFGPDGHLALSQAPPVRHCRPSVDVLFASVAGHVGAHALGIILTGMGDDGTNGATALRRAGARVIAQDEATSLVYGMPKAAADAGAVDAILPLDHIIEQIAALAASAPAPAPAPDAHRLSTHLSSP